MLLFEADSKLKRLARLLGWNGEDEYFQLREDRHELCAEAFKMIGIAKAREWFGEQCDRRVIMRISESIQPVTIDG